MTIARVLSGPARRNFSRLSVDPREHETTPPIPSAETARFSATSSSSIDIMILASCADLLLVNDATQHHLCVEVVQQHVLEVGFALLRRGRDLSSWSTQIGSGVAAKSCRPPLHVAVMQPRLATRLQLPLRSLATDHGHLRGARNRTRALSRVGDDAAGLRRKIVPARGRRPQTGARHRSEPVVM